MELVFHLGHNEELSRQELETVLGESVSKILPHKYLVDLDNFSKLNTLAHRLGGLVKVYNKNSQQLVWHYQAKAWYKRDRLKPFANSKMGMLPPKIARIMVNLCSGKKYRPGQTLLDPFCGSGNILMEAGLLNLKLIGSDINLKQLEGTRKNLNWLGIKNYRLLNLDATQISKQITTPVDYIVTEPFMGKPNLRPDRIKYVVKGLHKLYLGSLKSWQSLLTPNGGICMVFPIFDDGKKEYRLSGVIDDKSLLGYNIKTRGLIYSKPKSTLKREIVVLKKKK